MEAISQAISTLILNAVWQVPAIGAAAWIATPSRASAALRYRVWLAALILASVVPLATTARRIPAGTTAVRRPTSKGSDRGPSTTRAMEASHAHRRAASGTTGPVA